MKSRGKVADGECPPENFVFFRSEHRDDFHFGLYILKLAGQAVVVDGARP